MTNIKPIFSQCTDAKEKNTPKQILVQQLDNFSRSLGNWEQSVKNQMQEPIPKDTASLEIILNKHKVCMFSLQIQFCFCFHLFLLI